MMMIQAIVPTVAISQSILLRVDKSLGPIGSSFRTLSISGRSFAWSIDVNLLSERCQESANSSETVFNCTRSANN